MNNHFKFYSCRIRFIISFCIFISSLIFSNDHVLNICEADGKGYPMKKRVYSLDSSSFQTKDFFLSEQNMTLSFAEYGKEISLEHPSQAERLPSQPIQEEAIQKCREVVTRLAEDIVRIQSEDDAIQEYLTAKGEIKSLTAENYINLVETPEEQTVQIDPATKNILAEFRSSIMPADQGKGYCVYLTFVYNSETKLVERIFISRATLRLVE